MAEQVELLAPSVTGPEAKGGQIVERELPKKKAPTQPDDFDSPEDFLTYVRECYDKDVEYDQVNRDEAVLDTRFLAGEQWDDSVRARRAAASKPTLTINRLPAFVAQLNGNRRLSDIGIKVIPDGGGSDKKTAKVREGLIRSIQRNSKAKYAYDKAFENQVIGGLGNFQVHLDYAHDDVFEQDIHIAAIPNAHAVVWDRNSVDPTGADAGHVFVVDQLPRKEFKLCYPGAQTADFDPMQPSRSIGLSWDTSDSVRVVSFWRMRSKLRTVALLKPEGKVVDITDLDPSEWFDALIYNQRGEPMVRETHRKYAEMHLCASKDILAGPYQIPVQRVPVFRVPGWEIFVESDRIRWGLVRHARDPQKLHNYWRSVQAEKLVASPKAVWLAASTAVEGREDAFRKSHISEDKLIIWNAESGQPPVLIPPIQLEPALIEQSASTSQDIRDVLNMHESALGMQGNEVSAKAINARSQLSDLGSVIYQENLNAAIEECGQVINQLIPFVYDTPRILKIMDESGADELVSINDSADDSIDIAAGKYTTAVVVGPSYVTRRTEAREEMMAMVNAMPQTMAVAADKIIENQEWPGAEEIARRVRTQLPPGMLSEDDMDDQMKQQQAQAAQAQQQKDQIEQAAVQLELTSKQVEIESNKLKILETQARIQLLIAQTEQAESAAVKNLADIQENRIGSLLKTVEATTPQPATNGTK